MSCNDGIATEFEFEREVAYSREPNHPKQYVQNLLTRDAAKIHDLWVKYAIEYFGKKYERLKFFVAGKVVTFTFVERSVWLRV